MSANRAVSLFGGRSEQERRLDNTAILRARVRGVVSRIAHEHGCSVDDLYGTSRYATIVRARHHAIAVLRWSTSLSLPDIGRIFNRDHTPILAGIRKYEDELNPPGAA